MHNDHENCMFIIFCLFFLIFCIHLSINNMLSFLFSTICPNSHKTTQYLYPKGTVNK